MRSSNDHFHPPASPETPMVMVCAGTGLSPFRGFLQERAVRRTGQKVGPALPSSAATSRRRLLYRDELKAWRSPASSACGLHSSGNRTAT
jgi:cytochrome P450/NADPH-cytochrome P450 reductase